MKNKLFEDIQIINVDKDVCINTLCTGKYQY